MTARGKMTMRATLERDTQAGVDNYNSKAPPDWTVLNAALPCYLFEKSRPVRHIDGDKSATVSELICMMPKGTDVKAGDRLNGVVDRLGAVIHSTPLKVQGPQRRAAWGHIAVTLEDAST